MTWLQHWTDALLLHYPLTEKELRPLVPRSLAIDTYGGQAWLSYVFFRLSLRPPWLPHIPGFSSLVELNVRTYVRHRGYAGICFLRMYADNRLAIWASRWLTPLCYEPATMIDERLSGGIRRIECCPLDRAMGKLAVTYSVAGQPKQAKAESLDEWLLERYRLFVAKRDGSLVMGKVEHVPWKSAAGNVMQFDDSLSRSLGLASDRGAGVVHYSAGLSAKFGAFRSVQSAQADAAGAGRPMRVHAAWRHDAQ